MQGDNAGAATADLLRPFATLGELGRGMPPGHGDRVCLIAMAIADRMGLDDDEKAAVLVTSLLFHAGCTAGSSQFAAFIAADEIAAQRDLCMCDPSSMTEVFGWMRRHVATSAPFPARLARVLQVVAQGESTMAEFERGCSDVGRRVALRLGMPAPVQRSLQLVCETFKGKGPHKVAAEAIPVPTRIVQAAMLADVFASDGGPDRARDVIAARAGRSLDPGVARAFADVARPASFWEEQHTGDLAGRVRGAVARSPAIDVDEVVHALADVVDLKSPATAAHCRTAGELVGDVARELGFTDDDVKLATQAAWVHDVGKVGVPCAVIEKRGPRTPLEEARSIAHVGFSERILGSSQALAHLVPVVRSHHERLDGSGPQGEREMTPAVRVLAAVDAYLEDRDARTGPPSERSADALRAVRKQALDPACLDALEAVLERGGRRTTKGAADLSEREQEILALVARGLTNKEIAKELHLSAHTVRHHLEHVYEKIDVISRSGATLFAVEHGYA